MRSSNATASWTGFDEPSGIGYYEVRCDDEPWINLNASTAYTFNGLADGSHMISVRAVDGAGNEAQRSVNFIVSKGSLPRTWHLEAAVVALVVVAALAAVVYFLWVRKR